MLGALPRSVAVLLLASSLAGTGNDVSAGPVAGQVPGQGAQRGAARRQEPAADLGELRRRWAGLTDEERTRMRQHLAELKKLSPEERRRTEERARRLDQMSRQLWRGIDPEVRARLEKLPAAKRRQILREMVVAEASAMGRRILSKLPADERKRLESASGEERVRILLDLRRQMNERIEGTFERIAPDMDFSPQEIERLRQLPSDLRREKFLEIVKRRTLRAVELHGLPAGVSPQRWRAAAELPPDEFYLALLRLRREHPSFGLGPGPGPERERREAGALWRLRQSLQLDLDPQQRLALSHLSRAERRAEMRRRQRRQALQAIRSEGLLPQAMIERLERSPDQQFFTVVRELVSGRKALAPEHPQRRAPEGRGARDRPPNRRW